MKAVLSKEKSVRVQRQIRVIQKQEKKTQKEYPVYSLNN